MQSETPHASFISTRLSGFVNGVQHTAGRDLLDSVRLGDCWHFISLTTPGLRRPPP